MSKWVIQNQYTRVSLKANPFHAVKILSATFV